jgi:hypothetical protein
LKAAVQREGYGVESSSAAARPVSKRGCAVSAWSYVPGI